MTELFACEICGTTDFTPPGKKYDAALRCADCRLVFCLPCARVIPDENDIGILHCPRCEGFHLRDEPIPKTK